MGDKVLISLKETHKGKRILLDAKQIYKRGFVPRGKEEYLFRYWITNINEDCESAHLEYENNWIVNGGYKFQSYPDISGHDSVIKNYNLCTLKDDHELYNAHLGSGNRLANNENDTQLKQEEKQQARSSDDV